MKSLVKKLVKTNIGILLRNSLNLNAIIEKIALQLIILNYFEKYFFTNSTQKFTPTGKRLSLKSYLVV